VKKKGKALLKWGKGGGRIRDHHPLKKWAGWKFPLPQWRGERKVTLCNKGGKHSTSGISKDRAPIAPEKGSVVTSSSAKRKEASHSKKK